MKKNTRLSLVVFLALVGAVVWVTTRKPERGIVRTSFAEVKADAISKLELSGKNSAVLEKSGEDWLIVSGASKRKADGAAVKRAVEQLPKIVSSDLATDSTDKYAELEVDSAGDAPKGTRVKAYAGDQVVVDVIVGKTAGGGTNVRVGEQVFLVKGVYAGNFTKSGNAWLEKKLFSDEPASVTRLEVQLAGKQPYALVEKDGAWGLEDASILPKGFRFDAQAAKNVVTQTLNLRAKDILDADPGADKTKLDDPVVADILRYTTKSKTAEGSPVVEAKTHELRLGAVDGGAVYGRIDGGDVVTIYESTVKNLKKEPLELRDFTMVQLDKDKVVKLTLVDGGKKLVLAKKGADWAIESSSDKPAADFQLDQAAVGRRLTQLASTRGLKVANAESAAQTGLGAPSATVTATTSDGKSVSVVFGKETKDDNRDVVYAKGNADAEVYLVAKWTRQNLTGQLETFKTQAEPPGLGNLDPKALSGLPPDVRKSLEQQMQQKKQEQELLKKLQAQQAPKQ